VHNTIHLFACNYAKYSPILKLFFTGRLRNKPFLNWLLKFVVSYCCGLQLSLFSDISVSQGSAATHMRCGGLFNKYCAANLVENLTVKKLGISIEN